MPIHSSVNNIGSLITVLQSVESTNNYAMAKVHAGMAKHGDTWVALEQTAGKGQRGRSWQTQPVENIILSTVLEPGMPVYSQFLLSMTIALGCFDFFSSHAGDETSIKWPNDLYWRDRKAGGILIENLLKADQWLYAIAGIGININQTRFPEAVKNPVSLKQITGKAFDPLALSRQLCEALEARYRQLKESENSIVADYNKVLYKKEEIVRLKNGARVFETRIKEVDRSGQLITEDVIQHQFAVGEVEWITAT